MSWLDPAPPVPTAPPGAVTAPPGAVMAPDGRSAGEGASPAADASAGGAAIGAAAAFSGLVAFSLGLLHLLPGVAFWDTGEMQTVAPVFGTAHPTGYPTYVVLGWLASVVLQPFGAPALLMNLLSAILIGATVAVATLLFGRLTGRPVLALAGGIVAATLPEAWYLATHADPHALHALLLVLVVLLLVTWGDRRRAGLPRTDRWLVAAAVAYGAALGNQALMLLAAPGIALFVLATEPRIVLRPRMLVGCVAAVLGTTALFYLQLPLAVWLDRPLIYARPATWDGFWYIVLGEQFRGSLGDPFARPVETVRTMADAMSGQLGVLALAVVPATIFVAVRRPRYALLTIPTVVITLAFAAVYENAEIERYHLGPALIAVSWLVVAAGWLADVAEDAMGRARAGRLGGRVVAILALALVVPQLLGLPGAERSVRRVTVLDARDFVDTAFDVFAKDATVVSWWSYSTPLWYGTIVEGRRPDLRIVDDRTRLDQGLGDVADVIRADLPTRPVYVIPGTTDLRDLEEEFVLVEAFSAPQQPVYRVLSVRGVTK